jgi:hypothetical protein
MKNRREFLMILTAGLVALVVVITPVIADELFGVITNVDVQGKKVTVLSKDGGETVVTTTNDTEISAKGEKADLDKLANYVKKQTDAGKKGAFAKVTHENKVASKILLGIGKKKDANP